MKKFVVIAAFVTLALFSLVPAIAQKDGDLSKSNCLVGEKDHQLDISSGITLRLECGEVAKLFAYRGDQLITHTILPRYLQWADTQPLFKEFHYSKGTVILLQGCYPYSCPLEGGVVAFDSSTQKFYRLQWVTSISNSDESSRASLNGRLLNGTTHYINLPLGRPPDSIFRIMLSNAFQKDLGIDGPLELVNGRLCGDLSCDGGGQLSSERYIPDNGYPPEEYGLKKGMLYTEARTILLGKGWVPVNNYLSYPGGVLGFSELTCTATFDVCTGDFSVNGYIVQVIGDPTFTPDDTAKAVSIVRIEERLNQLGESNL